jgi:hypothetical protein
MKNIHKPNTIKVDVIVVIYYDNINHILQVLTKHIEMHYHCVMF